MAHSKVIGFFDKFEDRIRIALSRRPIAYAIIGGIGIVLFWKGVWETAELFPILYGPPSALLGVFILLATGLLVSFFIGDSIILSGINREKKLVEKTETEVREEQVAMQQMMDSLKAMERCLERFDKPRDS